MLHQVGYLQGCGAEATDRDGRTLDGDGPDDRVDTRPVLEAGVD